MSEQPRSEVELFAAAANLPADRRSAFLDEVCGVDHELRARIGDYLDAHDQPGPLDAAPPGLAGTLLQVPVAVHIGTQIGPYKIREQVGEGGMGVVYVAEQTEPICRKVALKIIKPGMDSRDVLARFDAERQALALMDHPNIARVFDGGATDTGQPFFVMELVQGLPVTEYCDQRRLGTQERLKLFLKVCRAVHHAHQKGVIHRDLKPSNVLVAEIDGEAVSKVIDFGVAKAVNQKLSEQTVYTQFSQLVGTPLYMSPEQAGLGVVDVDTRSDVYSLGVLLYELLTGQTPFDGETLKQAGFDEMRRKIREDERPRPSAMVSTLEAQALSTVAERRGCDPRELTAALQGELDWLVMKALEKDRNRRYESASALAADIDRYLSGEAVEACPPSLAYRFKKFARRNKAAMTTASFVLLALLFGIVGTSWQAWQAIQERDAKQAALQDAEQSAAQNKALVEFFVDDLLGAVDPEVAKGRDVTVEEVLVQAEGRIDSAMKDQPLVEAAIRHALGTTYAALAKWDAAERHLQRAIEIRRQQLGSDRLTFQSQYRLGTVLKDRGHLETARLLLEKTRDEQRQELSELDQDYLDTTLSLGHLYCGLDRHADAERLYQSVYETSQQVRGREHEDTLAAQHSLANMMMRKGRYSEALDAYRKVLEVSERSGLDDMVLAAKWGQSGALADLGEHAAALPLREEILESREKILGEDHPKTLEAMGNLASTLHRLGDQRASGIYEAAAQRAYELKRWSALAAITWDAIARVSTKQNQAKMSFLRSIACSNIKSKEYRTSAHATFELGIQFLHKAKESDELVRLREEAAALLPAVSHEERAMILTEIGNDSEAIEEFLAALKDAPDDQSVAIRLTLLQAGVGDRDGARETLDHMRERFGTTSDGITPLSFARRLTQQHRLGAIRKFYEETRGLLPGNKDRLNSDIGRVLDVVEEIRVRNQALLVLDDLIATIKEAEGNEERTLEETTTGAE